MLDWEKKSFSRNAAKLQKFQQRVREVWWYQYEAPALWPPPRTPQRYVPDRRAKAPEQPPGVRDQYSTFDAILERPGRFRRERSKDVPGCSLPLRSENSP